MFNYFPFFHLRNLVYKQIMMVPILTLFLFHWKYTPLSFLNYMLISPEKIYFSLYQEDMYKDLLGKTNLSIRLFNHQVKSLLPPANLNPLAVLTEELKGRIPLWQNRDARWYQWVGNAARNPLLQEETIDLIIDFALGQHAGGANHFPFNALMENPSTTESQITRYALAIPIEAGTHPKLSTEILDLILKTHHVRASYNAAINPNSSIELAAKVILEAIAWRDGGDMSKDEIEPRCDEYLKTLGYDEDTLATIPYQMKLKLTSA